MITKRGNWAEAVALATFALPPLVSDELVSPHTAAIRRQDTPNRHAIFIRLPAPRHRRGLCTISLPLPHMPCPSILLHSSLVVEEVRASPLHPQPACHLHPSSRTLHSSTSCVHPLLAPTLDAVSLHLPALLTCRRRIETTPPSPTDISSPSVFPCSSRVTKKLHTRTRWPQRRGSTNLASHVTQNPLPPNTTTAESPNPLPHPNKTAPETRFDEPSLSQAQVPRT